MFDISFINRCKFFSFLILIVFGFHSNAQRYQFISHSVDDGLIWTQVRSIYQDSRGYLWIGTLGGLSRFDGDEFKNYSVKDGLLGNHIECIYEDDQGQLWFGTLNGVSKYDGLTFESIEVDVFRDHFVRDIQQDKKGNYWFSSDGSGICLYDAKGDSLTNFREDDGLINNFVRTSTMLDDGSILFGTREGISRFQNNQFSQLGIPVLDTSSISEIQGTDLSNLSVSAYGIGLVKVNNEGTIIFDRSKGLQTNNIRGFVQYKNDYWTFSARGISHITPDTIYNYDKASGLPTTDIRCGLIDKDENIWIGSNGEGLLKFIGRHFISFSENNGLSSNEVMSFIEDEEGKIWLSTLNQGLMTYSNKGFEYLNMSNSGLPTNSIFSSYKDNSGNLWFGSDLGPLKLDNKTFINIYDKFNLSPSRAYSIVKDNLGQLWVGGRDGVVKLSDTATVYDYRNNEIGRHITKIICDKNGTLWFATANGLYSYDDGGFKNYKIELGWGTDQVLTLGLDHMENLWLGTQGGLIHYDGERFTLVNMNKSVLSYLVNSIEIDQQNRLWAGTNKGVFRFALEEYYTAESVDYQYFSDKTGIQSKECNQNALYEDSFGRIWIGSAEGANLYNPKEELIKRISIPKININEIDLFFSPVEWDNYNTGPIENGFPTNLQLSYNKNYLSFRYAGIDLLDPGNLVYRFRLDGFDDDWLPQTTSKEANYPNLPHGTYTFRVQTRRLNEGWNKTPAIFSFTIIPPYWKTWWFMMLIGIVLTIILIIIVKARINALEQKRQIEKNANQAKMLGLEQQTLNSSMNRHFVFNSLNSIQYYINSNDRLSANKYLTKFAKLIRRNLNNAESATVVLSEEIERIKLYFALEHMRFENEFTYEINVDPELDVDNTKIPAMLLQPFIENSILHGVLPLEGVGNICVNMKQKDDNLVLQVIDSGVGISESIKKKGYAAGHISKGMRITKERLALLSKVAQSEDITIEGPQDNIVDGKLSGTIVNITLPLDPKYLSQL